MERRQLRIEPWDRLPIRAGLGSFMHPHEERLRFIKQLGVDDVLMNMYRNNLIDTNSATPPLTGTNEWDFLELVQLRRRVEDAGLRLYAIENFPIPFYDKVMLGLPGWERQLDHLKQSVLNLGRAGIPVLGYGWMPSGVWRSSTTFRVRGGAHAMSVDAADFANAPLTHGREFSEAEMWEYYHRFLEEILPVAEEAGVIMALHPNDPPVPALGGVPQLFRSREAFARAMDLVPSPNHGLEFCLGSWSEMGENIHEVIDAFGADRITYVHFQTVSGAVPTFHEVFVDESAGYDPVAVLRHLKRAGFNGMIMPGHVPAMEGDGPWKERGRAFTIGFIRGILATLEAGGEA